MHKHKGVSSLPFENLTKTNTQVSLQQNSNIPKQRKELQIPYWWLIRQRLKQY